MWVLDLGVDVSAIPTPTPTPLFFVQNIHELIGVMYKIYIQLATWERNAHNL